MTNGEKITQLLIRAQSDLAELVLWASKSDWLNPGGDLYALWCDDCGNCGDEGCSETDQLDCIRRFLDRECHE